MHCCRCQSEAQKVSAVWNAGSWVGTSSGRAIGYAAGGLAVAEYGGRNAGATRLASLLAPPQEPQIKGPNLVGLVGVLLAGGAAVFFTPTSIAGMAAIFALLAFVLAVAVAIEYYGSVQARSARPRWEQAMSQWEQLYYCQRCDSVSNPSTGQYATVTDMAKLL